MLRGVWWELFEFTQLKELIDYYLTHDDERERVRKAGYEYVKANCTYHNRLQQMLDIVFGEKGSFQRFGYAMSKLGRVNEAMFGPNDALEGKRIIGIDYGDPHGDRTVISGKNLKINLGAGREPLKDFVNTDWYDLPGIDLVHNLIDIPYPFGDESADVVRMWDVLEHMPSHTRGGKSFPLEIMNEVWRILIPGGKFLIHVPDARHPETFIDITHVRGYMPNSFDHFDPDTDLGKMFPFYSDRKWRVAECIAQNKNLQFTLIKRGSA